MRAPSWYWCCLLVGLSVCGCDSSSKLTRGNATGLVTFDGDPVEEGVIAFVPAEGTTGPATGGEIRAGRYQLKDDQGPIVGNHKVEILAHRKTGEMIPAIPPATGDLEKTEQYIPAKFNTQTTLRAEVSAGENEFDFELQSE